MSVITKEQLYEQILFLSNEDIIFARKKADSPRGFHLSVICNDVFTYASSDSKAIDDSQIPLIHHLYKTYSFSGVIAWLAYVRKQKPLKGHITENYKRAFRELKEHRFVLPEIIDESTKLTDELDLLLLADALGIVDWCIEEGQCPIRPQWGQYVLSNGQIIDMLFSKDYRASIRTKSEVTEYVSIYKQSGLQACIDKLNLEQTS